MATKARRHIHKYRRILVAGVPVWACALPQCSHYMPRHMEDMLRLGKTSLCNQCGIPFILNDHNMESAEPICARCERTLSEAMAEFNQNRVKASQVQKPAPAQVSSEQDQIEVIEPATEQTEEQAETFPCKTCGQKRAFKPGVECLFCTMGI